MISNANHLSTLPPHHNIFCGLFFYFFIVFINKFKKIFIHYESREAHCEQYWKNRMIEKVKIYVHKCMKMVFRADVIFILNLISVEVVWWMFVRLFDGIGSLLVDRTEVKLLKSFRISTTADFFGSYPSGINECPSTSDSISNNNAKLYLFLI